MRRIFIFGLVVLILVSACARGGVPGPPKKDTSTPSPEPTPTTTEPSEEPSEFEVYFIDIGQGDATLIRASNGETLLIDGGRSKTRIRERLTNLGITDLDAILATHPDSDHIAGLVEVFDLYEVERFYWNGQVHDTQTYRDLMAAAEAEGAAITISRRGDTIPLGGLSLQVLHPSSLSGDSNIDSIVVLLSCGTVEILLTGDAEIASEEEMLAAAVLVDIEILRVGHHGSRTSTSAAFLTATSPEIGVISAGLDNQYGHPHQEVVDRLTAAGVELWYTDISDYDDTILLVSDCQTFALRQPAIAGPEPTPTEEVTPTPTVEGAARPPAVGEILINEFLPNPSSGNEWVELYNVTSDPLELTGMWLDDIANGGSSPKEIPENTIIPPGGYYVHDMGAAYLNNGGDDVRLLSADQNTVFDSFSYSSSQKGLSYCRQPDGGAWSSSCTPTKDGAN